MAVDANETKWETEKRILEIKHAEKVTRLTNDMRQATKRIDQGSVQSQGEAGEVLIEETLKNKYPNDEILEIPKGKKGADVLHKIKANEKIINLIFSKWLFYYISSSFYKYKILLNIKKKYPKFALIDIVDRNLNEEDKLLYAPDSTILSFKLFKDVGINLNIKVIKVKFDEIKNLIIFIPSLKDKKNKFSISFFLKFLITVARCTT